MEIIFSRLDENNARFQLAGCATPFANSIRRAMIGEVPTLAIETVKIYDNTSALFDEMLSHRLGLIPIRSDEGCMVPQSRCSCGGEGCPSCSVVLTMSVEGPAMVYSRDLISQDPRIGPAEPDIPIVKLIKDQKVVLEARAVMSVGREHAKWQPTTACGYKLHPVIKVNDQCDGCGQCVEECPRGILEVRNGRVAVIDGKLEECSLCQLCMRACMNTGIGDEPGIVVTADESRFLFVVEGDGSLPVREIIGQALEYIRTQSSELSAQIEEITGETRDE
ncbi:MAG: DNA-directed RNA polymerase subunit D [Methanoregulaceae archaeon]|jgi:DNA-directed RNA polymerase subunit D|nr:DNA-directed RNA polymerase subunit D [Methanoregulaceae archaeon]